MEHNFFMNTTLHKQLKPTKNPKLDCKKIKVPKADEKLKTEYFNSFIYTDNITNESLLLSNNVIFKNGDANDRANHPNNLNSSKAPDLKQCMHLLRKTKKFHLSTLQLKNYQKGGNQNSFNESTNIDQDTILNDAKRTTQNFLRNKKKEKENFQKQKQILTRVLRSTQHSQKTNMLKQHINQLKHRSSYRSSWQQQGNQKKDFSFYQYISSKNRPKTKCAVKPAKSSRRQKLNLNKQNESIDIDEQQIKKNADMDLRYRIRKNGEFLITPQIQKRLIPKTMNRSCRYTDKNYKKFALYKIALYQQQKCIKQDFCVKQNTLIQDEQFNEMKFKLEQQQQIRKRMKLHYEDNSQHKTDNNLQEINLIQSIELGNYFKVEIQLSVKPLLLLTKDTKNLNNLLHICIMKNKPDIFEMILKKCQQCRLNLLTQKNKYGRNPIQLGQILMFFRNSQLLSLVKSMQKQKYFYTSEHKDI